jgi:molybdopterin-containing oxidoreductase family membrane subunit
VGGAIFSGFAMVVTLAVPLRSLFGLKDLITLKNLENCAKLMLVTGLIVAYGYYTEAFNAWYSGNPYEMGEMWDRWFGRYWPLWWVLITCNVIVPQFLWSRRVRRSPWVLFVISLLVNVGMWIERFIIVIQSLHHDFIPSEWRMYYPTFWDYATFVGTIGLFLTLFLLFCRYLPVIAAVEMRELVHEKAREEGVPHA